MNDKQMAVLDAAPWTKAKQARDMRIGERGNIYFQAVNWTDRTVDLDGLVFGSNVRTPTCAIWRLSMSFWRVISPDLKEMLYRQAPPQS